MKGKRKSEKILIGTHWKIGKNFWRSPHVPVVKPTPLIGPNGRTRSQTLHVCFSRFKSIIPMGGVGSGQNQRGKPRGPYKNVKK